MRVLHVNTVDISGGAARAMYRLHRGLGEAGARSRLLALKAVQPGGDILAVSGQMDPARAATLIAAQETVQNLINASRTERSDTLFSVAAPGVDIAAFPCVEKAQVINLHWVAQFLSPQALASLAALGKPVVWRMPDQWAMTGGCHYAAGCDGFLADCRDCPQLAPELSWLPRQELAHKILALKGANLTVACPSRWMADLASRSPVFRDHEVTVVHNGVDTGRFRPDHRAKRRLGLEQDTATVLFVATHVERRKGLAKVEAALERCLAAFGGDRTPDGRRIVFLCIGKGVGDRPLSGVETIPFGYVDDDRRLALIYAASDLFVMASLEDNLPSTVLEAMACGAPVAGFRTGGVPDLVEHGVTGLLAEAGDTLELGQAMEHLLTDKGLARSMGAAARARVEREFSQEAAAGRYLDLYRTALARRSPGGPITDPGPGRREELAQLALAHAAKRGSPPDPRGLVSDGAFSLRDQGRAVEARRVMEAMAILAPNDMETVRTLGALHAAAGECDQAVACFRRCLEMEPGRLELILNISDALRYAGRLDEALNVLREIGAVSSSFRGLCQKRGQVLAASGRHREAIREFLRECRTHGGDAAMNHLRESLKLRSASVGT